MKTRHFNARSAWLGVAIALIIIGFALKPWWLGAIGILVLLFWLVSLYEAGKAKELRRARAGSTRVETVKASHVNLTIKQYTDAGWSLADQSSAKSFGSQARVTLTFRK